MTSAPFDAAVPESRSKPDTPTTESTPGIARASGSTCARMASVRSCEAASGNSTCMKTAPLSSSGTKPVGTARNSPTVTKITMPSVSRTSSVRRASTAAAAP